MRITVESEPSDPMQTESMTMYGVAAGVVAAFMNPEEDPEGQTIGGMMRVVSVGYAELMPSIIASMLVSCRERFGDDFLAKVNRSLAHDGHGPEELLVDSEARPDAPSFTPRRRRVGPNVQ